MDRSQADVFGALRKQACAAHVYGSGGRGSQVDSRPNMLDFLNQVKIPMQFPYGTRDGSLPHETVEKLRGTLSVKKRKSEIYLYEDAEQGFADF